MVEETAKLHCIERVPHFHFFAFLQLRLVEVKYLCFHTGSY